jgi:ferredoxin
LRLAVRAARPNLLKVRCVPKLEFVGNGFGSTKTVDVVEGGELVDICDLHFAPIPFSCRSASCGTCHVHVLEGAEFLEPPEAAERELLGLLGGHGRLACQARVRPGPGFVRIRSVLA